MRIVFWTYPPSTSSVRRAISNARAARFLDGAANRELARTISKLAWDIWLFVPTALREVAVNLRNGLLKKGREFNHRLQLMEQRMNREDIDASGLALEMLGTRFVLQGNPERLRGILTNQDPVLLVANHVFAPIDGLVLMHMVHQFRRDYSLFVNANNGLISVCPQYRARLIPVDNSEGLLRTADKEAVRKSRFKAIRHGLDRLEKQGQCLIIFPAGNVSKAKAWGDEIADEEWQSGVGFLVRRFASTGKRLTVLPAYFPAHMGNALNSQRYHEAYLESRTRLPAAMMEAFFNPPPTIDIHVGEPLPAEAFRDLTAEAITRVLREKVYEQALVTPRATRRLNPPQSQVREPVTPSRLS